ncbi:glycosyltransferase [Telluribacter sp. SYSU D00476]|uniref:glycosyltransferase n=1 Tax=Telluribacter sp. SYSU D00476 TaxID=2811430 RepID=UPI001FF27231|nr:glycosyltransferase [Telluribacter sp. SYSU D00476]
MKPSGGGPCQGIRNSIPELEKMGIHNEVLCFDDPAASFLSNDAFPIHTLGPTRNSWKYNTKLISWLLENFGRFDYIIVHGLWLYHSYAVHKALVKYKKLQKGQAQQKVPKLFVMPHGMLDPWFQRTDGRKLKAVRNWAYWKLLEANVVNEADGVLFTCEAELRLAREPFRPYRPKREINIGYGVAAPPTYTPVMRDAFAEKCPELHNQPYFLFLSRIHEKKGVDLLIEAYAKLVHSVAEAKAEELPVSVIAQEESNTDEFPDLELPKLVIAGPGLDTPYGIRIQQLAAESGARKDFIFFPGMLTGDAKWGAFYGCEAFVLPSHQENFGIAVVEALACGKPVLISDQVNIWREIEEGKSGLVDKDTVQGTLRLLTNWAGLSPEKKKLAGTKAKHLYDTKFAVNSAINELVVLLKSDQI